MTDQPPCSEVMILADWQLFDCIERGHIRIDPYDKNLVQPNTLDIWLGNHFVWYTPSDQVINPHDRETIASGVEERETDEFVIRPGAFVLARTLECIGLPDNIVAAIEGKSSTYGWASPFTRPEAGSMPE